MEKNFKNKNFIESFKNTINGIIYVLKTCKNIKIEIVIAVIVIIAAILLKLSLIEWSIIIITIFFVLATETINSAIEVAVDLITQEYNEKAKITKDIAGGVVTIAAINSVIIGIIIFGSKILVLIKK